MRFFVSTDSLTAGASLIEGDAAGDGTLPPGSLAAAGASTPIAGAWTAFFSEALSTAVALDQASIDTAGALRLAAGNYNETETANREGYAP